MKAEAVRSIAATVPPVLPMRGLNDEASVMMRSRLPGGLFEIRYDGANFGVKQLEKLRQYVDLMLDSAIEWEEGPGVLVAAKTHDPEPVALTAPMSAEQKETKR